LVRNAISKLAHLHLTNCAASNAQLLAMGEAPTILEVGESGLACWEARRDPPFLRIVPHAGSRTYLSLVRHAATVVGNSSSGLFDTPTLKVPVINIGSRQTGRMRGSNVVDVDFDRSRIGAAIRHVLHDPGYREARGRCRNPFGDGRAAERTVAVLKSAPLGQALIAKWLPSKTAFFPATIEPPRLRA
jgi:UDP-N-acetylglucosamine 2-epimerase